MKALVYTGPGRLQIQDRPDPVAMAGQTLVRVARAGICGSDMHAFLGHDARRPAPLILGHEIAGIAVESSRRVTVNPLVGCGSCAACRADRENLCPARKILSLPPREGGFAEFVAIRARNLVAVPGSFAPEQAALAEPLACSWHAVRLARATCPEAETALVLGGGAIGLGAALCLKAQGAGEVLLAEPNLLRRRYLDDNCGLRVTDPADLSDRHPFDIVIDAVGVETTRKRASALARPGGVIAHIGLGSAQGGLDLRRMTLQEITFIGSYTFTAQDFRDTAQAMFEGRLGALDWTETRPLDAGQSAFDDIRAGRVAAPKILLQPQAA